jgi:hypothetical protein
VTHFGSEGRDDGEREVGIVKVLLCSGSFLGGLELWKVDCRSL